MLSPQTILDFSLNGDSRAGTDKNLHFQDYNKLTSCLQVKKRTPNCLQRNPTVKAQDQKLSKPYWISYQDTNYRRSIPAEERLSICLWFLATGDSYRTIAGSFRAGISTVSMLIPDVVAAIWDCLVEEFMAVPGAEEWRSSDGGIVSNSAFARAEALTQCSANRAIIPCYHPITQTPDADMSHTTSATASISPPNLLSATS
uniref:Transposase n=1 Tax=Knipowitschia caucasica TaxID=637954 RepID=A0AAV2KDM8_KNICA